MQIPYGIHQMQPCEDKLQNRYSEKKLCQSLFANKVAGLKLTKKLYRRGFLVNFTKYLRILFYGTLLIHIFVTKDTILLSFQFLLQGKQFYW